MRRILFALSLFLSTNVFASPLWEDVNQQEQNKLARSSLPSYSARVLRLDEPALRQQLLSATANTASKNRLAKPAINKPLELPLPDGSMVQLIIEEYPLLSKALATKFPDIKAWKVHEAHGKNIYGRIDLTEVGFHAMLTLEDGDTIFIDPHKTSENNHLYDSFSKRKNIHLFQRHENKKEIFIKTPISLQRSINTQKKAATSSKDLITYRLALAATGEYVALKGGTKAAAFSAMMTTINRVNQIYERDLSVRLVFIDKTYDIIYTNPNTDPFTHGNAFSMLDENIANMDAVIGDNNYDIGHLFGGAGTGGLALLSGVCRANKISHKAGGITGSASPYGDSFNIDYVAHEMGHQLGATHTFNSETKNCSGNNREADTAVEPGSGSTIMSYAGICGKNNLQINSDAVFNAVSIAQINNYIRDNEGATCGKHESSGNTNPSIIATQNFTIPSNTPFVLTSTANDADGDQLNYTWDQIDANGTTVDVDIDTGDNPLFRSYLPSALNYRYFPHINTLFGELPIKGEKLALTDRELNFATTVRDNKGGIARADTKITTSGNPFTVISQYSSYLYQRNENIQVRWNVAGTNKPPVNCQTVDIKLLAKDGTTQDLLLNTVNDGSQNLNIPNNIKSVSHARIMVACRDNIFFAVSKGNIAIGTNKPPTTSINVTISNVSVKESSANKANFTITLSHASDQRTSIQYTTVNGTAKAGSDFLFDTGVLLIPAGKISETISIPILNDQLVEDNETFQLQLSHPSNNINLFDSSATATIIDDDKKIDTPADKQDIPSSKNDVKKAGGTMSSILIFLMLYLSLLKLRIQVYRSR
ncbi:MAG: hypothetical protein DSZ29_03830 [Aquificaceae bacterium]|nr:MAG: hypothetical protein DSZ29_03830 [Aquificaceae bacterium]